MATNAKTWFITGCSTGFGRVLVEQLLKTHANVVATARKPDDLKELKGERLLTLALDVTKPETITAAVDATKRKFGRIDVLVNNAGYGMLGAIEESAMEDVERMFDTNVFGLLRVTQAVLPIMREQKAGYVLNLSSAAGVVATAGFGMYNGTKFAVEGLSQALALEVKHLGIHVSIIEPGPFRTDFADRSISTQPPIADYEESVGKTRAFLESIAGKQAGDPVKAAQVMIDLAEQANPPLQVPLGHSAIDRIMARSAQWKEEMERAEKLARTADFDDAKAA